LCRICPGFVCMISRFYGYLFFAFIINMFWLGSETHAFIPGSHDIISLATEKIVEPVGMKVVQQKKIYQELNRGIQTNPFQAEPEFIEIKEKLWFSYPGKFRSEAETDYHDMICVESKGQFVKIIDEYIEAKEKSITDLYTDILLFRKPESLTKRLKSSGVDIKSSSLKRYDGVIYFVVGTPPEKDHLSSSFWVEKDTGFPGRYTIFKDNMFLDIFYKKWKKISRTWYPMEIVMYLDGLLFSRIDAESFELEADFEKNFFNVKRLKNIYPESSSMNSEAEAVENRSSELEKSIIDFKNIYE